MAVKRSLHLRKERFYFKGPTRLFIEPGVYGFLSKSKASIYPYAKNLALVNEIMSSDLAQAAKFR
jgi:hypothetical protein